MKRNMLLFLLAGFLLFAVVNCTKSPTEKEENKTVTLSGQVINSETLNPITGAIVRIQNISPEQTIFTDTEGSYQAEFEIEKTTEVLVIAFLESFRPDTIYVLAVPGRVVSVPLLKLTPTPSTPGTSGVAASIILKSQSALSIGVRESGAVETASLTFEVQDSLGNPINILHGVEVFFYMSSSAGGGEFIYPLSARTGYDGHAETYITSGTTAGVVQLRAEFKVGNRTIRSKPIAIAIHGGLPDPNHFSVAPSRLNFPGYNRFGVIDTTTAFVGDKYANPVRPGTVVYFTCTGGIIQGSALTNAYGEAVVNLISAAPQPSDALLGPGFATITATTLDETNKPINTEALVLFSGRPQISIDPTDFDIPNGGSVLFDYTVSDQNGNPLSGGTNVKVDVKGNKLLTLGALDFTLGDTQSKGRGTTEFSFAVMDTSDVLSSVKTVSIDIEVTGPNGARHLGIVGTSH